MFVALWAALLPTGFPMPYGFLAVLIAEGAVLGLFYYGMRWVRTATRVDQFHFLLLLVEAVCHSLMFYFLGGVNWLGAIAFLYALIYAAWYLSVWQAAGFTLFISACYLAVTALDATGTVPHQWYLPQDADRYKDLAFVIPTSLGFIGVAGTVTFWMVFIGGEIRRERDVAVRAYTELARAQDELRKLNEELEVKIRARTQVLAYRAERDTLTGLLNRGTIARRCREMLSLARRTAQPVAVIVADGDNFKNCNDMGGHAWGDEVLTLISRVMRECARETDLVGRFGGDEFLMVLPDTETEGAAGFCDRMLSALAEKQHNVDPRLPFPTLSLGIAIYPDHGTDTDSLIRSADGAMYKAKARGGNRWQIGDSEAPTVRTGELPPRHAGSRMDSGAQPGSATVALAPGEGSPLETPMANKAGLP
jgi:diguanylate cyclase (GGDEF)-like protein